MNPPVPAVLTITTAPAWNARYPVGTRVTVGLGGGLTLRTRTDRPAWTQQDGKAVVSVVGCVGLYHLVRVSPAE